MSTIYYAPLLFGIATAMPWLAPMPTPMGLMAIAGVSPRPTEAPGLNGIPPELRRREDVQYPPPANWCGFVNSNYDDPLSCSIGLTCVNSLAAFGCCTATTGVCTALYTTCVNYRDECDQPCQSDPAVKKCDQVEPFCGTYAFLGDSTLFNCMATSIPIQDVEFLNDFYITAIGSTLAPDATINPFGFTASASLNPFPDSVIDSASSSASSSVSSFASSSVSSFASSSGSSLGTTYMPSHSGLSQGAIDGIAAGVAVIGAFLFGLAGFCCLRARRRKRMAGATHYPPAPMQQQAQQLPSKAFDGYQSVPQHEQQSFQYPGPHQQAQSSYPPLASAVSPPPTGANDPRFSSANASLPPYSPGEPEHSQGHYIPPLSPTVTEVDGTMGNPGAPAGVNHRVPTEVDGTMGNPGVPAGGHGIETQLVPGGSPSAAEIDGRAGGGVQQAPLRQHRVTGASMNQPYSEGPYELGHERS